MQTIREQFISKCHELYDKIHGKEKISNIFDPITSAQLNDLIHIYKSSGIFIRNNNIQNYIETKTNIEYPNANAFYSNALQHFLET